MSFRKLILLLAIFTLTTVRGESLLNVRHYSLEDGLSQNTIQSILQDDKGYIWLATWNGLERFDGYSFKNYKSYPTDRVRLSYNRITHIEKGFGSHIWCQTFGGHTYLFDSDTEQFLNPLSEQGDFISGKSPRIFPLKKGVTWVVTPNGKLYRVDEKRLTGNAASETCENIETLPNDIYRRAGMDTHPKRNIHIQPTVRKPRDIPPLLPCRQHRILSLRRRKTFLIYRREQITRMPPAGIIPIH